AIECGANIIPFMNADFTFPEEPLPADIEKLGLFNGVQFSHNEFSSSMNRLVSMLKAKRPRRKLPAAIAVGGIALLVGSFALARLMPNDDDPPDGNGSVASSSKALESNPGGTREPATEPPPGQVETTDPGKLDTAVVTSDAPTPGPAPTVRPEPEPEPEPEPAPEVDYAGLASGLMKILRSESKTDLPEGLQTAIEQAGDSAVGEIPSEVIARMELICLRMALEGSWVADADIEALKRVTEPPFESSIAPLALANEKLELADGLIKEKRIEDANQRLREGFELLDLGIERKSEVCRLKKGSLLTRHLHFKYNQTPGLQLPGNAALGLSLMEEAYKAFRARNLDRRYFAPAEFELEFDDALFEANAALVIAQCWHHGIGTGMPQANDADGGFDAEQAAKKAIDYYQKVLELDKDNGEARAGLLEMWIVRNEGHWDKQMIDLAKRGTELDDDYCMYQYASYLWAKDPRGNEEEVRALMDLMARPRRLYTEKARKWLEQNRRN
ncbi:MAG: hypothetical protein ACR2RV_00505, partial [Verrucomicrobiales bacterium]